MKELTLVLLSNGRVKINRVAKVWQLCFVVSVSWLLTFEVNNTIYTNKFMNETALETPWNEAYYELIKLSETMMVCRWLSVSNWNLRCGISSFLLSSCAWVFVLNVPALISTIKERFLGVETPPVPDCTAAGTRSTTVTCRAADPANEGGGFMTRTSSPSPTTLTLIASGATTTPS